MCYEQKQPSVPHLVKFFEPGSFLTQGTDIYLCNKIQLLHLWPFLA